MGFFDASMRVRTVRAAAERERMGVAPIVWRGGELTAVAGADRQGRIVRVGVGVIVIMLVIAVVLVMIVLFVVCMPVGLIFGSRTRCGRTSLRGWRERQLL